jgi:hypothetical protein
VFISFSSTIDQDHHGGRHGPRQNKMFIARLMAQDTDANVGATLPKANTRIVVGPLFFF